MEGCSADDAVEGSSEWKVKEIGSNHLSSLAELWFQVFAGGPRHVLRDIERDHATVGQSLEQIGGKAPCAGTGVENYFVASQLQAGKDLLAPANLWLRKAMIFGGIPFAG